MLTAASIMVKEDISSLVITDDQGCLAGVLTRTDILRAGMSDPAWRNQSVAIHMTRQVVTALPSDSLGHIAALLREHQIHRVVIVQKQEDGLLPVGVISDADILYHLTKAESEE
ncbi:MAG: CBS domain-containing protein [Chloroflexi bacterium]|nr:CBS domain-containing protein [Chloroflexota bacterium]